MLEIIIAIIAFIFLMSNDEEFLNEGQHRDFFGNILDADGELNIWDTFVERNGWGGNPLFWDWDDE